MDPSVANPGAGGLLGAYVFGGDGPGRQGWTQLFDSHFKNFAPRFGFAYNMRGKTRAAWRLRLVLQRIH